MLTTTSVRKFVPLLALAVGLPLSAAGAQPAAAEEKPWSAGVGANFLTNGSSRDAFGDAGFRFDLGYSPRWKSLIAPKLGRPSFDFEFSHTDDGARLNVYGLTYTERIRFSQRNGNSKKVIPYVGAGIGGYYLNSDGDGRRRGGGGGPTPVSISPRPGSAFSDDKFQFGGKAILGLELTETFFVEASYTLIGKVGGRRADSVNLTVGLRF